MPTNAKRAQWARNALDLFSRQSYGESFAALPSGDPVTMGDDHCALKDVITDLLHLTVELGWDPEEMLELAKMNFDAERTEAGIGD